MKELQRYSVIDGKLPREIVLLRSRPCIWGRCTFCDYIDDNTEDLAEIERVAAEQLARVRGLHGRLEVINSGSIQELPRRVWEMIRQTMADRDIRALICESYWAYRHTYAQVRAFFPGDTRIKLGVETFDDRLRNEVLNKNMHFAGPAEVACYTDTICLLVGFRGQTRATIARDIELMTTHFGYGCVNLFSPNRLSADLRDPALCDWFRHAYADLRDHPTIEVLWENTDFGVGEIGFHS